MNENFEKEIQEIDLCISKEQMMENLYIDISPSYLMFGESGGEDIRISLNSKKVFGPKPDFLNYEQTSDLIVKTDGLQCIDVVKIIKEEIVWNLRSSTTYSRDEVEKGLVKYFEDRCRNILIYSKGKDDESLEIYYLFRIYYLVKISIANRAYTYNYNHISYHSSCLD